VRINSGSVMYKFKDVFISYGRADSKAFAFKLHDRLVEKGKKVWFDQKDIPLGVDFQEQIDDGIEKTHNFIFIIAPHSVKSQYCLKEILLAIKQNKRIIPILHIEPSDCWDKMHPTIAKLNWIYFREGLDDFETSFQGLLQLLENQKDYVYKHTYFLNQALEWERNQNQTDFLLQGKDRLEAQDWLQTRFEKEQPPCEPTRLHSRYICEAKKVAENNATDVFLSAVPVDLEQRSVVQDWLNRQAISTWTPETDIPKGVKYELAIKKGIESATNFLFFMSEEAVSSEEKQEQVAYAKSLNKRIIPLLVTPVPKSKRPHEIRFLPVIDFTDNRKPSITDRRDRTDLQKDLDDILNEIRKHQDYYWQHKNLLVRALQWKRQNQNPGILLRGWHLMMASSWKQLAGKNHLLPALPIQKDFFEESSLKNPELETEVYLCYALDDTDFVRKINYGLQSQGKITWFDKEYIDKKELRKESFEQIEKAHIVLYIISPDAIQSIDCQLEIKHALSLSKKIIPVIYKPIHQEDLLEDIAVLPSVESTSSNNFQTAFGAIVRLIDMDSEYLKNHTKWLQEAMAWDRSGRSDDLLLRGSEYSLASAWLEDAQINKKNPAPTRLQIKYIKAAEDAILVAEAAEHQRQAQLLELEQAKVRRTQILAIFVAIAALGSIYLAWKATINRTAADKARIEADSAKVKAIDAMQKAQKAELQSRLAEEIALNERDKAKKAELEAQNQKKQVEIQRDNARRAETEAKNQRDRAEEAKKEAEQQRIKAEQQRREAEHQQQQANIARADALNAKGRADKLYMLSQSKILSVKAIQHLQDSIGLSVNLALHGYFLNQEYDGEDNTENYNALYQTLKTIKGDDPFRIAMDSRHTARAVTYHAGKEWFAAGQENGKITIWSEKLKTSILDSLKLNLKRRIRSLDFAQNGDLWASTTQGELYRISFLEDKTIESVLIHKEATMINRVRTFQFNGEDYVISCAYNSLKILKMGQDEPIFHLKRKNGMNFNDVAVCTEKTKSYLIVGQSNRKLRVWQFNALGSGFTLKHKKDIKIKHSITAVALSPNGKYFAIGSKKGFVGYGLTASFKIKTALLGHTSKITQLTFDSKSTRLASACLDQTSRLWNLNYQGENINENILVFREPNRWVWGAVFTRNDTRLVTVTQGGYVHLWATESRILMKKLCQTLETGKKKIQRMSVQELKKFTKKDVRYRKSNCLIP